VPKRIYCKLGHPIATDGCIVCRLQGHTKLDDTISLEELVAMADRQRHFDWSRLDQLLREQITPITIADRRPPVHHIQILHEFWRGESVDILGAGIWLRDNNYQTYFWFVYQNRQARVNERVSLYVGNGKGNHCSRTFDGLKSAGNVGFTYALKNNFAWWTEGEERDSLYLCTPSHDFRNPITKHGPFSRKLMYSLVWKVPENRQLWQISHKGYLNKHLHFPAYPYAKAGIRASRPVMIGVPGKAEQFKAFDQDEYTDREISPELLHEEWIPKAGTIPAHGSRLRDLWDVQVNSETGGTKLVVKGFPGPEWDDIYAVKADLTGTILFYLARSDHKVYRVQVSLKLWRA
jgi:hypothetical protein